MARILANGGRVLNVCALGKTVREAQARAYQAVDRIKWPDGFCRRDIAWQAVEREQDELARDVIPERRAKQSVYPRDHEWIVSRSLSSSFRVRRYRVASQ